MRTVKHIIAGLVALGLVAAVSIPAIAAPIGKLARPFGFHAAQQPSVQPTNARVSGDEAVQITVNQAATPPGLAKGMAKTDDSDGDVAIQFAATIAENEEQVDPAELQAKYDAIAQQFQGLSPAPDATAVQNLHVQEQLGLGAIVRLLSLAEATGASYTTLLAEHKAGAGWGELARKNNIHPGSLQNPGAIFGGKGKAGAASGPPGLAAGGPPGLAKARGVAKGQGASGK